MKNEITNIKTKLDLKKIICSDKNKSGFYSKETTWKKIFTNFYTELLTWDFPNNFKFKQKVYHYLNNDLELKLGKCPVCGNRCKFISVSEGYTTYCSTKCMANSIQVKEHKRNTCMKKFGTDHPWKNKNVREKAKQTCLEKYNNTNFNNRGKAKETCLNRYNIENPSQLEEVKCKKKQTCIKNFGIDSFTKTIEYKKLFNDKVRVKNITSKIYSTKKKNNSFHTSKIEKLLEEYFLHNNINFITQYKSDLYPFNCDFYFPDKDLYIEIQGTWVHGGKPFTGSIDDLKLVEKWKSKNTKYYDYAINVWTIRDVRKRETAKQNNLNWLEIFSSNFEECIEKINKIF